MAEAAESRLLCGTAVSIDDVSAVIRETFGCGEQQLFDVNSWTAEEISGAGFMSVMIRLRVNWSRPDETASLPDKLIVKVTTIDKMRKVMQSDDNVNDLIKRLLPVHNGEAWLYRSFEAARSTSHPLPAPVPRYYGSRLMQPDTVTDNNAFLLLQDMGEDSAMVNLMKMESLTDAQLKELMVCLGGVHAWSTQHDDWYKPEWHNLIAVKWSLQEPTFAARALTTCDKIQTDPLFKDLLAPDVASASVAWLRAASERIQYDEAQHRRHNVPDMMVHGDLHTNNMLFTGTNQGPLRAILDWQCTHFGDPNADLCQVLTLSTDPGHWTWEYRKQTLQEYHAAYNRQLDKYAPGPRVDKARFEFDNLWKSFRSYILTFMQITTPGLIGFYDAIVAGRVPGAGDEAMGKIRSLVKIRLEQIHELMQETA